MTVNTISSDLPLVNPSQSSNVFCNGYYEPDGGGGHFYWDAAFTEDPNGGTIIASSHSTTGRWRRVYQGAINIRWFGAISYNDMSDLPNPIQDLRDFIKHPIFFAESEKASVYIPAGIYPIWRPIIIRSNTRLFGDGPNSAILNFNLGSPHGNCIHVGIGREYQNWEGLTCIDPEDGAVNCPFEDASLLNFASGYYDNITTSNVIIENLCLKILPEKVSDGGMGIWTLNASNVVIRNIWSDGCATPVNVANDYPDWPCGCRNIDISNVFVINAGRWYDLVYIGEAENVNISNCYSNPDSLATLSEMIAIRVGRKISVSNCHLKGKGNNAKVRVLVGSYVDGDAGNCQVHSNIFEEIQRGVVLYRSAENAIQNNRFINVVTGVHVYSKKNFISTNVFTPTVTKAITIQVDSHHGVLANNLGIDSSNIEDVGSKYSDWFTHNNFNYFTSNLPLTQFSPCFYKKRFNPVDAAIDPLSMSKITLFGAYLTYNANGNVTLYYRMPDIFLKLTQLKLRWYAHITGEKISLEIVSQNLNDPNMNHFNSLYSSLNTASTTRDKIFDVDPVPDIDIPAGSPIFVKLELDFNSNLTQLRDLVVSSIISN